MAVLVIYDSFFGNTEKIAQAISNALDEKTDIEIKRVGDVKPDRLQGLKLLIIGSPTRAFRPSPAVSTFLKSIPNNSLQGVKAAVFDTRISTEDIKSRPLCFMVRLFGYAAKPMAEKLRKKGAEIIVPPEGFLVEDTEGPIKEGELQRAAAWAKQIEEKVHL
jgi:flavodoxin I